MVSGCILLYVNGIRREVTGENAFLMLLDYLRRVERVTGAKLGCGEGGCGACTVMLSRFDPVRKRLCHIAVNACLLPVSSCDGSAITTIEAVGNRKGGLSPIQRSLAEHHGSQCGFCTPGIVMSAYALLRSCAAEGISVTKEDMHSNFDGNLCRCTGYRPILDAFSSLVANGGGCCASSEQGGVQHCQCARKREKTTVPNGLLINPDQTIRKDSSPNMAITSETVFPLELLQYAPRDIQVSHNDSIWYQSVTMDSCLRVKSLHPKSRFVVGNSEIGIEVKFKGTRCPILINISHIPELTTIKMSSEFLQIGAAVTWTQLLQFIDQASSNTLDEDVYKFSSLHAIKSQLQWFAGKQIRNVGTVGGNIVTASPISDINPLWIAADAQMVIVNATSRKQRIVNARDFFLGYRKVDLLEQDLLLCVKLPWNLSCNDIMHAFKVSRRKEDDIAIVSAGIRFMLTPSPHKENGSHTWTIGPVYLGFGGLAPKTIAADTIEDIIRGKEFNGETLNLALKEAARVFAFPENVPGGMATFRRSLAIGFIFKAFVKISDKMRIPLSSSIFGEPGKQEHSVRHDSDRWELGNGVAHQLSKGSQIYGPIVKHRSTCHIGEPVKHASAELQVTGEATYLDDIPPFNGELQGALVLSTEAHATIDHVYVDEAERMPGVAKVILRKHLQGRNDIGVVFKDEACLAEDEVTTVGQIIACVLADTAEQAKAASRAVIVKYTTRPSVITIEDAIEKESYAPNFSTRYIEKGDALSFLNSAKEGQHLLAEGHFRIGAQEHFYFETQGSIVVPQENDEVTVYSSTQAPTLTQSTVARVLGIPMHKVVCKVKRIGGGFGGKETRSINISGVAAVGAVETKRPVRLILDRDIDMKISGTRHAFYAEYRVGFSSNGKIHALHLKVYLNMGNSADLSLAVLDRALYHAQNCYDIQNILFEGRACFTNTPSATAFRGFGAPQGMLIMENVIENVAYICGIEPHIIRDLNIYGKHGNGNEMPFGMTVNVTPLVKCWNSIVASADFQSQKTKVENFNRLNRLKKRGLSAIPTMYGISFTSRFLNQAGALVHIHHDDGSVLISHGGVEMGQGLHTKMMQVAATALGIPMAKVYISETATDKVANSSPTAASASSDMYGMAILNACNELKERLKFVRPQVAPGASWEELVKKAWLLRIDLSAHGFYKTPDLDQVDLSDPKSKGRPFYYYTNGAAVSEVEIDILTGEHTVLRSDIFMDIGRPLNPAVDIGQIEGAFIQGLGWCTMEEVIRGSSTEHTWVRKGHVTTTGPGAYKIPGFSDIPKDFRVQVLETRNEKDTIHSSKAVGEPPLFLAASVMLAIRNAVTSSREDVGIKDWFVLNSPATVERIRLACGDGLLGLCAPDTGDRKTSLSL